MALAIYQVIDDDGSLWLLADSFRDAEERWRRYVVRELDADAEATPTNILRLCEPGDLIPHDPAPARSREDGARDGGG